MCIRDRSKRTVIMGLLFVALTIAHVAWVAFSLTRDQTSESPRFLAQATPFDEFTAPFMEYVQNKGYPAEEHFTVTKDGYILRLFRIQAKNTKIQRGKTVVFLQHGISDSGEVWVMNDEDKAIGFVLANAGYDVWFGNNRGNKFSRNHTTLNPDKDPAFWSFSFQTFALYDQPAHFSYITRVTGQEKINYIGHSQGTTQMFAALADREATVVRHIDKFIALAPVVHMKFITNDFMNIGAISRIGFLAQALNMNEFAAFKPKGAVFSAKVCKAFPKVCEAQQWALTDADPSNINLDRWPVFKAHQPAGTSRQCLMHYSQLINDPNGTFKKYDFGEQENLLQYGQANPPVYDLSKITEKVYLVAGTVDRIADIQDIERLHSEIKSSQLRKFYQGHESMIMGNNPDHIPYILEVLSK
eukprot:TRINITY_DN892_c0_g1_i1.p1 TRINITY_DN892_c0_g1~~TRINITY_DN892_c0_g1_i1.p1  ORF type:complete len:414 (+),score=86.80 TRINITY_DN892_c0_g1_i1:66-1307(+)